MPPSPRMEVAPGHHRRVKTNSAVARGPTERVPQISSLKMVVLKKGVTAVVLTSSGQDHVSLALPTVRGQF